MASLRRITAVGLILTLPIACVSSPVYDDLVSYEVKSPNAAAFRAVPAVIFEKFRNNGGPIKEQIEEFYPARVRPVNSIQKLPRTDVYLFPVCNGQISLDNRNFVSVTKNGTSSVACP